MLKFNKENFISLIHRNKKLSGDNKKLRAEITNLHKAIEKNKAERLECKLAKVELLLSEANKAYVKNDDFRVNLKIHEAIEVIHE